MVVTDHASLTWLRNSKEPEGVVARWITRLPTFDFDIMHVVVVLVVEVVVVVD